MIWDIPPDAENASIIPDDAVQGSDEWLQIRAGKITASRISDMMAAGSGLTRQKYQYQLVVERMTGKPINGFKSAAMQRGNDLEPEAREAYEFANLVDVQLSGFIDHPTIDNAGASPDGLVGDDGLVEIKCPDLHTHIGYILSAKVPTDYFLQMQWQMAVTGRQWCDFYSYNPDMPVKLRAFQKRVSRDDQKIAELESAAVLFNTEINLLIKQLELI